MNLKDIPTRQINLRIPTEMRNWVVRQARQNLTSLNAEIVRCIAERRDRVHVEIKPKTSEPD